MTLTILYAGGDDRWPDYREPLPAALKAAGRGAAQDFLDRHWDRLGRESNVDLRAMFG